MIDMSNAVARELAPTGVLRAAINLANFLLVTGAKENGEPTGVSPDLAASIAKALKVESLMLVSTGPESWPTLLYIIPGILG